MPVLLNAGNPVGPVTVAEECEVSNAVHRALTVHGVRDPSLHYEVLRLATLPRMTCNQEERTVGVLSQAAGGLFFADIEEKRHAIWGRMTRSPGHSIYDEAEFYSNMVRA
eukprot:scaffold86702_cov42-Prasinocladus_malaysianus.AAC.1